MPRKRSDFYEQEMEKALHEILYNLYHLKRYRSKSDGRSSNAKDHPTRLDKIVSEGLQDEEPKQKCHEVSSEIEVRQVKVQFCKRRQLPELPRTRTKSSHQ